MPRSRRGRPSFALFVFDEVVVAAADNRELSFSEDALASETRYAAAEARLLSLISRATLAASSLNPISQSRCTISFGSRSFSSEADCIESR